MSSYVDSVIGTGEKVKYHAKVSIWSMVPLFVLGLILLPLYGLGLIFWLVAVLRYTTTELAITNKKIIAKFGFIKRDTIELLLPKAESVQVNQSILGRIFNYGSVTVSGAGNPQAPVPGIDSPMEFRKNFMEIQEASIKAAQRPKLRQLGLPKSVPCNQRLWAAGYTERQAKAMGWTPSPLNGIKVPGVEAAQAETVLREAVSCVENSGLARASLDLLYIFNSDPALAFEKQVGIRSNTVGAHLFDNLVASANNETVKQFLQDNESAVKSTLERINLTCISWQDLSDALITFSDGLEKGRGDRTLKRLISGLIVGIAQHPLSNAPSTN